MTQLVQCHSLQAVREQIDRIDRRMLTLLAERGGYVRQAAHFKKDAADVAAPERVDKVIATVTAVAREVGADPAVAEATWRAMIAAFIQSELATHALLHPPSS
jgi:isochorismate pyruvate lyase